MLLKRPCWTISSSTRTEQDPLYSESGTPNQIKCGCQPVAFPGAIAIKWELMREQHTCCRVVEPFNRIQSNLGLGPLSTRAFVSECCKPQSTTSQFATVALHGNDCHTLETCMVFLRDGHLLDLAFFWPWGWQRSDNGNRQLQYLQCQLHYKYIKFPTLEICVLYQIQVYKSTR